MNLSEAQKVVLPMLEWLLDPYAYRGSGRTTIMAMAFIRLAMRYPGERIDIFDHYGGQRGARRSPIIDGIRRVLAASPEIRDIDLNDRDMFIVFRPSDTTPYHQIVGMDESKDGDWTSIVEMNLLMSVLMSGKRHTNNPAKPTKKPARKISHVADT